MTINGAIIFSLVSCRLILRDKMSMETFESMLMYESSMAIKNINIMKRCRLTDKYNTIIDRWWKLLYPACFLCLLLITSPSERFLGVFQGLMIVTYITYMKCKGRWPLQDPDEDDTKPLLWKLKLYQSTDMWIFLFSTLSTYDDHFAPQTVVTISFL